MTPTEETPAITVSLEWAKKLKEAGWEKPCMFALVSWEAKTLGAKVELRSELSGRFKILVEDPTAEEVLIELPPVIEKKTAGGIAMDNLRICQCEEGWHVYYKNGSRNSKRHKTRISIKLDTLANASAKMWIYLKENNLL